MRKYFLSSRYFCYIFSPSSVPCLNVSGGFPCLQQRSVLKNLMSGPSIVVHISSPCTWEAALCEFKGSPVYIVSFRTVGGYVETLFCKQTKAEPFVSGPNEAAQLSLACSLTVYLPVRLSQTAHSQGICFVPAVLWQPYSYASAFPSGSGLLLSSPDPLPDHFCPSCGGCATLQRAWTTF